MPATIVERLLYTLGMDTTQYQRANEEAIRQRRRLDTITTRGNADRERQERVANDNARRRQRETEDRTKATVRGLKQVRDGLLAIGLLFTAGKGITDFIGNTINTAAGLGYLSANLKMTTKDIQAYQRASERAGGTADGMVAQFKESADTLAQLRAGLGPNEGMQKFFQWGGNEEDLKDGNTYLLARARIVHEMFKTDPGKAALIAKQMGIAEEQFNFIKLGPDAIRALVKEQEKHVVINEKDAAAALVLKNRMLDMRDAMAATATRILIQLQPVLEVLFQKLEEGAKWLVANKGEIGGWIDSAVNGFKAAISVADKFATSIGSIVSGFKALMNMPIVGKFLNPIGAASEFGSAAWGLGVKVRGMLGIGSDETKGAAPASAPAAARAAAGKGAARGLRNNNPGNIEYGSFTKNRGATGSDGRFAKFDTAEQGIGAMADLMRSYGARGFDTVDSILARYAPGSENNTAAYSSAVSKKLGVKGSDKLNLNDPAVMKTLIGAMIQHENGSNPYGDDVMRAATMSPGQRKANASMVGQIPGVAAQGSARGGASGNTTTTVHVDNIQVVTQAKDANGIALALRPALEKNLMANQANTGMN